MFASNLGMHNYNYTVTERFLRYVQIDTQSNPHSNTFPSTKKQKNLSKLLAEELQKMGVVEVDFDEYGYVYATLPANIKQKVSTICFCAHVDTAPDCSGTNVKPIVHKNYQGQDIILPDDPTQIISLLHYPYLKNHIGYDIITASGNTLLGADDKSGVAIIMDLAQYLLTNPTIPHGTIKLLFTPDEEIGHGTAKLSMQKLNADIAYTLDGGELGIIEDETFNADSAVLDIHGVSAHPGYAKGKMMNALKIAGEILTILPKTLSPEQTEGREGFIHPVRMEGVPEKATIEFILRDFTTAGLQQHAQQLHNLVTNVMEKYPQTYFELSIQEQYRNMKEVLQKHPQIVALAEKACTQAGIEVRKQSIRGGTDGSKLSFMGLPCANIFTGMQAIHSKQEWIGVRDMQKAVDVLIELVQLWAFA